MKRWILPLAAFLVSAAAAHVATRHLTASRTAAEAETAPKASHPSPDLKTASGGPIDTNEATDREMLQRYFKEHPGDDQAAARLIRIARTSNVSAMSEDGELMPAMIELLGLNPAQAKAVQQSLDKARERSSQDLKSRLVATTETDPAKSAALLTKRGQSESQQLPGLKKVTAFDIAASPAAGQVIQDELQREIAEAAGTVAAEVIMDEGRLGEKFAAFGAYPIHGTIEQFDTGDIRQRIQFEILDNDGNLYLTGGTSQVSLLRERFGSAPDEFCVEDPQ